MGSVVPGLFENWRGCRRTPLPAKDPVRVDAIEVPPIPDPEFEEGSTRGPGPTHCEPFSALGQNEPLPPRA